MSNPCTALLYGQKRRLRSRNLRRRAAVACAGITALLAAACSAGTGTSHSTSVTLNIGTGFTPNSLNPAKINAAFNWYVDLAYDPLIYMAPDGSLQPRLAASWNYVGSGNRVFDLNLRPHVKFSDGSPLTANVVKQNIDYFRSAGGSAAAYLASVTSVDVVNSLTVRLRLSKANPLLPRVFSQEYQVGDVISGAAIAQPQRLATQTFGTGPYILDAAQTVANDHYTYTPNPYYWDKTSIHYQKVVIKVLPNASTALDALRTGQVDVIQGDQTTVGSAKAGGLSVAEAPEVVWGLAFADRAGTLSTPLGNVLVRQALNYGIDRGAITRALYGVYGTPTEQLAASGQDGYSPDTLYAFDPAKARQLLARAGYPNGFTVPVLASPNGSLMAQAVADDLRAIGVRLQITTDTNATQYLADMAGKKYPAYLMGYGTAPVFLLGPGLFLPSAAQFNPFRTSDPTIESLYDQAAAAEPGTRATVDREIIARLNSQAWFAPVTFGPVFVFSRPTAVSGVQISTSRGFADPVEWMPA